MRFSRRLSADPILHRACRSQPGSDVRRALYLSSPAKRNTGPARHERAAIVLAGDWPGLTAKADPKSSACRTRSDGYPLPIHRQSTHRREAVLTTCEGESAKAANRHAWRSCHLVHLQPTRRARSGALSRRTPPLVLDPSQGIRTKASEANNLRQCFQCMQLR
jgi:hypothetical protein